ncbi:hypothetical protein BpHYR1_033137 [Brachionus plicatilis]|uniref:Uncharacterized protein n=1 Tax=Brachionus plicatilis TaxID=10195 RepID=A0A3M7SU45_BRAPC|nr:hypothetical protein BpHYR1_033137 [Brachionus plicatilis]
MDSVLENNRQSFNLESKRSAIKLNHYDLTKMTSERVPRNNSLLVQSDPKDSSPKKSHLLHWIQKDVSHIVNFKILGFHVRTLAIGYVTTVGQEVLSRINLFIYF